MHIAEGVLAPAVLAAGAVITLCGTGLGLRKMDTEKIVLTGIFSALFFLASLIHIPVGVSSAHLIGSGILGIFLGYTAFPAILVALTLQAVFFQYGGITVLGVNTATMASSAVLAWYLFRFGRFLSLPLSLVSFLTGTAGVFFAALLTALALAFSEEGFVASACALLLAHVPIMIAEGVIASFTITFIARVRPEILPKKNV
ncbi:MAG: cobalt transporter CbiM [Desulfovibrio sp.]|nr:cobalt transporter CbiM [Desulfovibrio sp.]